MENKSGAATVATICGIIGLISSILMSICFGVIGGGISIALGIVAIVMGSKAKKATNGTKGSAGFICGLLAIIFAAIFTVGCVICGATESSAGVGTSYSCYGCVGGSCMAADDIDNAASELQDAFSDLDSLGL